MLFRNTLKVCLLALVLYIPTTTAAQCTATLTASTTNMCQDSNVVLQASPTGLYDYQWFVNGQLGPLGMETWNYSNWTPGTYTFEVQITDNNNCTVISNPVTVTIYPQPEVSIQTNNSQLCPGSNIQLVADTAYATSIMWFGPNGFTANTLSTTISNFQVPDVGTYTAIAYNNGCSSWPANVGLDTVASIASAIAQYDSSWNNSNVLCEGDMFWIDAITSGFSSYTSVEWTGPNGFSETGWSVFNFGATVLDSGIYTLTVTGTTCSGPLILTDDVYIAVNASPVVTATSNGPLCAGSTLLLDGTASGGTYEWTGPNGFTSTNLTNSIPNMQSINSGTYTLTATNGTCTSAIGVDGGVFTNNPFIDYYADTGAIFCAGDVANVYIWDVYDVNNPVYLTTGPNGFSSNDQFVDIPITNGADSGIYTITVTGTNCSGNVTLTEQFLVDIRPCVWPGDVNNDMIANNMDVLDLGLGYGTMGPNRPSASYSWHGQYMTDWGQMQFCNQEMKFADCNGNGILTASDTFGIALNYGSVHQKPGPHIPMGKSAAWPDLYFDMAGITLTPGAAVAIPIKLGTSAIPMVNVYGLGAQIKLNGITPDSLYVQASGWMGNANNTMNFTKRITQTQTDWAYVRTDHTNVNGDGTIAYLQFVVPQGTDYQQVTMYFDNVRIIGNTGNVITNVNVVDGETTVWPTKIAAAQTIINSALVVPNPSESEAKLQLSLIEDSKVDIVVTDITGRKVWNSIINGVKGQQDIPLPTTSLTAGIYTIQVKDAQGNLAKTLKWVKK